jgi:hypothetical protein
MIAPVKRINWDSWQRATPLKVKVRLQLRTEYPVKVYGTARHPKTNRMLIPTTS